MRSFGFHTLASTDPWHTLIVWGQPPSTRLAAMRILVHDFGGYAFPVQLSRSLARRGHTVRHAYCASLQTTPPGIHGNAADAPLLRGLHLAQPLNKYALMKRWRQEREYGWLIARECAQFRPDVVLSGNTPLSAQHRLMETCRKHSTPFVYWAQDLLGIAAFRILRARRRILGETAGRYLKRLEGRLLRASDEVIAISQDFAPLLRGYGVPGAHISVIENWACLEEMPTAPKNNAWAQARGLGDKACLLYAGTLSMKHNPDLLLQLALAFRHRANVVVISQGLGADWLRQKKAELQLGNLLLLPFQAKEDLPFVVASADALLAVLEPDAGVFSVPSKVLAYFCAARPILLAVPEDNLAARIVQEVGAGRVAPPGDAAAFVQAAADLLSDPLAQEQMGRSARAYAERAFDIEAITDRFAAIFDRVNARVLRSPA